MKLSQISVEALKGVGDKLAAKLGNLGIASLEDLLFHLPSRYQDRSRIHPIGSLLVGQTAQIFGQIEAADIVFGKRRSLVCKVSDGSGIIDIRFFYFSMSQKKQLKRGEYLQCYGQVARSGRNYCMIHPEIKYRRSNSTPQLADALIPIYPTTEGLQQRSFRRLIDQALELLSENTIQELLPPTILSQQSTAFKLSDKNELPALASTLAFLHQPPLDFAMSDLLRGDHPLIKRLAFEELVAQQLGMMQRKQRHQQTRGLQVSINDRAMQQLKDSLPFQLTGAQQRVIDEILKDLTRGYPMMRLVQGDVGCGKTLVAAFAMLATASAGLQSVMMAPTELLAEQHYKAVSEWFVPMGFKVVMLTSSMPAKDKKDALAAIASGSAKLIVGTHALFQQQVDFAQLALVVIDEQHRFGVEQRKRLLDKGSDTSGRPMLPHQLIMSATPIPRTLAQAAYADLDLSMIDELPVGRKSIETSVISDNKRQQVIARIEQACMVDKRQVYWVCTLIDESEEIESQAAEAAYQQLSEQLPSLKIGLVHGRLKSAQKNRVMRAFKQGELDILVATTVIEVGVDVPNATLMIIENPERLGLSQLHQLRGRVGRGDKQSYCVLMYRSPLSLNAKQRLSIMRQTCDGFVVAEQDLMLRGAGEVLGTRQTGDMLFRFADLARDSELLPQVIKTAQQILREDPHLIQPLSHRWLKSAGDLAKV